MRGGAVVDVKHGALSFELLYSDRQGMMLEKETSGPYGDGKTAGISKHGLSSNMYDADTGLYYFAARWPVRHSICEGGYAPDTGRFLQMDPVITEIGLINMYDYCNNNPLNVTDRYGEFFGFNSMQEFVDGLLYDELSNRMMQAEAEIEYSENKAGADDSRRSLGRKIVRGVINNEAPEEMMRIIQDESVPAGMKGIKPAQITVSTPNAKYVGYFITLVGGATLTAGAILTYQALQHGPLGAAELMGTGFMMWAGAVMIGVGVETIKAAKELEDNVK